MIISPSLVNAAPRPYVRGKELFSERRRRARSNVDLGIRGKGHEPGQRAEVFHVLERRLDLAAHGGNRIVREGDEMRGRRQMFDLAQLAGGGLPAPGSGLL